MIVSQTTSRASRGGGRPPRHGYHPTPGVGAPLFAHEEAGESDESLSSSSLSGEYGSSDYPSVDYPSDDLEEEEVGTAHGDGMGRLRRSRCSLPPPGLSLPQQPMGSPPSSASGGEAALYPRKRIKPSPVASGSAALNVSGLFRIAKTALLGLWLLLTILTAIHFFYQDTDNPMPLGVGGMLTARRRGPAARAEIPIAHPAPFFLRARRRVPLPLPPEKVSVVLMNYSRPRMIRESSLMRTLLAHPNVDEVVLLHSNPAAAFEFVHPKVVNIDATRQNDEMGLSLRFYFCQLVKNPWVLHVDDDMEFSFDTLSELLIEFGKNPHRIVGRFGRNLVENNSFNGYSSTDTHKESEVVLTKLMVMERRVCSSFFEYAPTVYEDVVLNNGEGPLWNGEDIFMALVANHIYGSDLNNYAMDWLDVWSAPDSLKDYAHGKLDICGGMKWYRFWDWHSWQSLLRRNRHYSYRGTLWHAAREKLRELRS